MKLTTNQQQKRLQKMNTMTRHPDSLYNEVLKDYNYRFPKFSPIPYPTTKTLLPKPIRPNDNLQPKIRSNG